MEQLVSAIQPAVMSLASVVITCLFGYIGLAVKKAYIKYVDTQTKKDVVESSVNYVEQVYTDIHGDDKLQAAKDKVVSVLNEKGIAISDDELELLIESAVYGLNQGWISVEEETTDEEVSEQN